MKQFSSFRHNRPLVLLLVLLLTNLVARAQGLAWQTALAIGQPSGGVSIRATAIDVDGNVYLAGSFRGTVSIGNATLTSAGGSDILLAKWNPASSSYVWVRQAGGTGNDYCQNVAVNGASVYMVGSFQSIVASFGTTTLTNSTASLANYSDGFVAKLTDTGTASNFEWAQSTGGDNNNDVTAVGVNGMNVYVTGTFGGSVASFGSITVNNATQGVRPAVDVFVAKLRDAGSTSSWVWAQQAGGGLDDASDALAVNGNDLYIAGAFSGRSAGFGGTTLVNVNQATSPLGGTNPSEAFIAKLVDAGSTGNFVWAQRAGGIGEDRAKAIAVSGTNVYVAGSFSGPTADIGATILVNGGATDGFVAKIIDAGSTSSISWAQAVSSAGNQDVAALALRGNSVYVTGYFESPTVSLGGTVLTSVGLNDIFVAKLSDTGSASSWNWAQQAGSTGNDGAYSMVVSGTTVYLTGYVGGGANFGSLIVNNSSLTSAFLASIADLTLTATKPALRNETVILYPSPAHGTATVQLPPIPGTTMATLTLLDALGRTLRTQTAATSSKTKLDLSDLAPGLYALRVQAGTSIATRRLVVE